MRLVMTLLARNEADIVDSQIAFHLAAGVDFVIATDNASTDGTREILERYEREGVLRLLREEGDDMRQDEWVTRMARLGATEHGADWVINSDADEFWWPRSGSLKEVFDCVPARYGVVRGCWRHFLPRPDDGTFFAERMTVRLARPATPGDKRTVFHAHQKVAHRATPDVWVDRGNHDATGPGMEPIRSWHPIEVLHFSFRSAEQAERKLGGGWLRNPEYDPPLHQLLANGAYRQGRVDDYFASLTVDDDALARGLASGRLAIDTRVRDALRVLAAPGGSLRFEHPDVAADAAYAAEASVLEEIDGVVRSEARTDALETRIVELERRFVPRLRARARRSRGATVD